MFHIKLILSRLVVISREFRRFSAVLNKPFKGSIGSPLWGIVEFYRDFVIHYFVRICRQIIVELFKFSGFQLNYIGQNLN